MSRRRRARAGSKRLRGIRRPRYRLRVADLRIFYDVTEDIVGVLALVAMAEAAAWLARHGEPEDETAEEHGERKR